MSGKMLKYPLANTTNIMSIKHELLKLIPDSIFLRIMYKKMMGKKLNLRSPETFSEKLQWLKLHNRNPLYTTLVDKYAVKSWVAEKIGDSYVIPTLGVWNKFEDIDFEKLPNKFVLKCTHDSGSLVVCKDKSSFNRELAGKKLNDRLKRNFYYQWREWPYKNVLPRIIAESYVEDPNDAELRDYKFYTFNGEPKYLLLASNRQSQDKPFCIDFFDMDFNHLPLKDYYHPNNEYDVLHKPKNFDKMKELARILAKGIPHVRIDFYEANGKVLFGEMTFYDNSGFLPFKPEKYDKIWGDCLNLPSSEAE